MKHWVLVLLLSFSIVAVAQQTITQNITVDGIQREFIIYIPAIYSGSESVPLILNFHGYTSNATEQMWYGDFRGIADTANFIVVHPQGTVDNAGYTHFNVGLGLSTVDDIAYTEAVIDYMKLNYAINENRIYSTGMSNGGYMSYQLACQISDQIAAIASVTGSMSTVVYNNCNCSGPMPVMEIHGTEDATVPYDGQGIAHSIPEVIDYWKTQNSAVQNPDSIVIPDTNTGDGSTAVHYIYTSDVTFANTELIKVTGGGHTWPGSVFGGAGTNQDFKANLKIWEFFSRYDKNGVINKVPQVKSVAFEIFPNPASQILKVSGAKEKAYQIFNSLGQEVLSGELTDNAHIDISALNSGVYWLQIDETSVKFVKD